MTRVYYTQVRRHRRSGWWWLSWLLFLPLMDKAFTVMMKAALVWPYIWAWKALKAVGQWVRPAR